MKKYLFVLLGLLVFSATTVYAQELTEKEKERQEKEAKKQAKENAKKEAKLKKAAKKDAKIAQLRTEYEEFLVEWTPIEANIGIAEVILSLCTRMSCLLCCNRWRRILLS